MLFTKPSLCSRVANCPALAKGQLHEMPAAVGYARSDQIIASVGRRTTGDGTRSLRAGGEAIKTDLDLARECGAAVSPRYGHVQITFAQLAAFVQRIRQDEREVCAKEADAHNDRETNADDWLAGYAHAADAIAKAIRSREQKEGKV